MEPSPRTPLARPRGAWMKKEELARRLVRLASMMVAEDEEDDEIDAKFVEKVRELKRSLPRLASKKRRKLGQYGIGTLKGMNTVEDLVDALMKVVSG